MGAIMKFMDKYIIPVAGKLGAQRHLVAVRDGFVAMIPITMIGALATLVNNLPIPAYQNFMKNTFGETWTTLGGDLWWGSIATMALFLVVGVAYNLAKSYDEDGLQAGLIALSIFFVMSPQVANIVTEAGDKVSGWGFVPSGYISNSALFTAIVIGLLATEIFVKLSRIKKINIKMPDGVPPAVARSFAKLIPGMLTIAIFGAIGLLIKSLSGGFIKYLSSSTVKRSSRLIRFNYVNYFLYTCIMDYRSSWGKYSDAYNRNIIDGFRSRKCSISSSRSY